MLDEVSSLQSAMYGGGWFTLNLGQECPRWTLKGGQELLELARITVHVQATNGVMETTTHPSGCDAILRLINTTYQIVLRII